MTYVDVVKPKNFVLAFFYDIFLIISCSSLIAFSSRIFIPLPFTPVPITLQTFSVLITGALLGSKRGLLSVILFIISGIAGLPVFAKGSGFLYLLGPTGGYIFGFLIASFTTGFFSQIGWDRSFHKTFFSLFIGNILIYIPGLIWLGRFTGYNNVLKMGFFPFLIGDIIKIGIGTFVLPSGWIILKKERR
uniref:Biotin transporter n=1 Tax=candidate division WOR-3 bacterium TaxID=2052148 RepID=A0A7C4UFF7_UNCW3